MLTISTIIQPNFWRSLAKSHLYRSTLIAVFAVGLLLVFPIFLIKSIAFTGNFDVSEGAAAATVALGAIFRSNSRNVLKSTFMSAIRTALRALTRRIVRLMLPVLLRLFLPVFHGQEQDVERAKPRKDSIPFAIALGTLTLASSFCGVILLSTSETKSNVLFGSSLPLCAFLAATTIIIHYGIMFFYGHKNRVAVSLQTSIDGIVLQAYFTGALSYLPLASDMSLQGTTEDKGKCASMGLLTMLCISLGFDTIGSLADVALLNNWAAHLLLYAFVIAFPLKPLDGNEIWNYNKLLWFAIFALTTGCFLLNIPEAFYEIL